MSSEQQKLEELIEKIIILNTCEDAIDKSLKDKIDIETKKILTVMKNTYLIQIKRLEQEHDELYEKINLTGE